MEKVHPNIQTIIHLQPFLMGKNFDFAMIIFIIINYFFFIYTESLYLEYTVLSIEQNNKLVTLIIDFLLFLIYFFYWEKKPLYLLLLVLLIVSD